MLRRIAILLVSLLFTTASWGVELGDIAQIMKSPHPDLGQAETLSRQFIAQKPNTTKGRYYLAMVLERKGEPKEALQALHEAQKLDPALKFASSPARFYSQESKLSAMAARQTAPAAQDKVPSSFKVPAPLPYTATAPAHARTEFTPAPARPTNSGGSGIAGFLLVVGALALFGALAWLLVTKSKNKKEAAANEKLKTEQQAELLDSTQRLDTVILSARADGQPKLKHAAEETRLTVGRVMEKLKRDDTLASTYDMSNISQRIARYESLLNSGLDFEPAAGASPAPAAAQASTSQQNTYVPQAAAAPYSPPPAYSPPPPYSAPQPTVVLHNDTSATDLLLAAGLGMALSGNHRNDSRVERETVYVREPQHDRYAAPDAEVHRSEYVEPAQALQFGTGGEDSGSSSNFDTGGSDSPEPESQDAPEPDSSSNDSFDSGGTDNN